MKRLNNVGDTKNATGTGSLTGIGWAKAGAVWYRAHTVYFTSGTTHPQARAAMLNAADDVVLGLTAAEQAAVAAAWSAIGVN